MDEAVAASEANRNFSRLLEGVRKGQTYVVTSHGKPVAKIVPATTYDEVTDAARKVLLARLRSTPVSRAGRWTREELYEDAG